MFKTCSKCGASLDFGEKCFCEKDDIFSLVSNKIGPISFQELAPAIAHAVFKQQRIIEREGDADGQRRENWYLVQLIIEQVMEKRKSAQLNESAKRSFLEMSHIV